MSKFTGHEAQKILTDFASSTPQTSHDSEILYSLIFSSLGKKAQWSVVTTRCHFGGPSSEQV